jgi:hypothetical protein
VGQTLVLGEPRQAKTLAGGSAQCRKDFRTSFFLEHFPAEMFDLGWTFREVLAIVS